MSLFVGEKFVKSELIPPVDKNKSPYAAYSLCNHSFEKIKELVRSIFPLDYHNKKWYFFTPYIFPQFYNHKVFFATGYDCEINAFEGCLTTNDNNNGWNGVFRGRSVNPGVFAWRAQVRFIDETVHNFAGDLTVLDARND